MVGTTRQTTLREVMLMETTSVPGKRARGKAQETITHLIEKMIAMDGQPFSLVENVAIHWLVHHVAAWYNSSHRRTMSQ